MIELTVSPAIDDLVDKFIETLANSITSSDGHVHLSWEGKKSLKL